MTPENFKKTLLQSKEVTTILQIISQLDLPDCWLCAGTIRNYFWDLISGKNCQRISDVDVIFFDKTVSYEDTILLEKRLKAQYPDFNWELKNEVYMHLHNPNTPPYKDSCEAVSKFPEKCTAIASRLDSSQELEIFAPFGIGDIIEMKVAPTPYFLQDKERMKVYRNRQKQKQWQETWPELIVEYPE